MTISQENTPNYKLFDGDYEYHSHYGNTYTDDDFAQMWEVWGNDYGGAYGYYAVVACTTPLRRYQINQNLIYRAEGGLPITEYLSTKGFTRRLYQ